MGATAAMVMAAHEMSACWFSEDDGTSVRMASGRSYTWPRITITGPNFVAEAKLSGNTSNVLILHAQSEDGARLVEAVIARRGDAYALADYLEESGVLNKYTPETAERVLSLIRAI